MSIERRGSCFTKKDEIQEKKEGFALTGGNSMLSNIALFDSLFAFVSAPVTSNWKIQGHLAFVDSTLLFFVDIPLIKTPW